MGNTAPDPAAWAACQVGLSPDAMPAEVRAALLRDVTREGFVPPPERQQAWQVLCGSRADCPPAALLAEEARLRNDLDDFAADFFAMPTAARRRRWQELAGRCASSPPLAARLAALGPGLDVELCHDGSASPRAEQLASHVAGLFVLAPAARAAQRQAVLRGMRGDIAGWEEAARQVQDTYPALAALEPTLLPSVLAWREQQQKLARLRGARAPVTRPAVARPTPATRAPARAAPAGSGGGKGLGCGAVLAIMFLVRLCSGVLSHQSREVRVPDPVPRFAPPAAGWRPGGDPPPVEFQPRDPGEAARMRRMLEQLQRDRDERGVPPGAWPPGGRGGDQKTPFPPQGPDPRKR